MRILAVLFGALVLSWAAQDAQAGAIRYAGKQISKGTVAVAQTTADAAQATGSGVATVGKATPGLVARGTKAVGKGIAKAIW